MNVPRKLALGLSILLVAAGCSFLTPQQSDSSSTSPESSTTGPTTEPTSSSPSEGPSTSGEPKTSPDRQLNLPASDVKPAGFVDPPPGSGMDRYVKQKVTWTDCGAFKCAKVIVPLDYEQPDGQAITLALRKRVATASPRVGSLFINPGGPGASGQDYVGSYQNTGMQGFDIIGWDPRGSGESTPVKCFGTSDTDKFVALDSSPDDDAEMQALLTGNKQFAASCLQHSGVLLSHISTQDTARDLDLLRQLVGDKELYYHGVSYGTFIGATYADMFPQNVGRMVMDAAVNITDDESVIQAMGFETAFSNFAKWCANQGCRFGKTPDEVKGTIDKWLSGLDSQPIRVGNRQLTQSLAVTGLALFLYGDEEYWQYLVQFLGMAFDGDGSRILWAADQLNGRADGDGGYSSLFYGFSAILCADNADRGIEGAKKEWQNDIKKAPIFAKHFGVGLTCPVWPVKPAPEREFKAAGAKPIMVIGGTGDSATPYKQAQWMSEKLESGFLVTFDGEGHGSYGGKSTCIDNTVVAYLTKGTVPQQGLVCKPK